MLLACGPLWANSGVSAQPLLRFVDEPVFTRLNSPTVVRFHPDGRVFVAEKRGVVRVFDSPTDGTPTTFVDLRDRVHDYWDRGLLGMALHPDFERHPYVYVLYTLDARPGEPPSAWGDECPDPPGGTGDGSVVQGRLSRFRAVGNTADGAEEVLVQNWCQQFPSHSIGALAFGSDGALYASAGDGASFSYVDYGQAGEPRNPCGDPPVAVGALQRPPSAEGGALRSQALRGSSMSVSLDGTLLRLDPATGRGLPDNPLYAGGTASDDGIIAYGLRNPFRFALRPGTREIWIADVGWNSWEEINLVADRNDGVVENFGWPCYEGAARQRGYDASDLALCENLYATPTAHTHPRYAYEHALAVAAGDGCDSGDSSISAIAFYDGAGFPAEYEGALFFGDYSRRCIWAMMPGAGGRPDPTNRRVFLRGAAGPADLVTGPDGALYYAALSDDSVRRIRYANGGPLAQITASATNGAAPLTIALDGSASRDPDGDAVRHAWDLDGDGEFDDASTAVVSHTFAVPGTVSVRLRVTDAAGLYDDESVLIDVDNLPPTAIIDAPLASDRFRVGQTIAFDGHADDPDQGALEATDLSWEIVLHHCAADETCHEHTVMAVSGRAEGEFSAPDHPYPSYLEVRLTATDALGLTGSTAVAVQPETTTLELTSEPEGLLLAVGDRVQPTPFGIQAILGSTHSVSASSPQTLEDADYAFASWSDDGAATHLVTLAGATTLHATFSARCGDGTLHEGEQCDDGNHEDGDCCSAACDFELEGSLCEGDGERCTTDRCDGAGACVHAPDADCDEAGAAVVAGMPSATDAGTAPPDAGARPSEPRAGRGGGTGTGEPDGTGTHPDTRTPTDAGTHPDTGTREGTGRRTSAGGGDGWSCAAAPARSHASTPGSAWLGAALVLHALRMRRRRHRSPGPRHRLTPQP